MATPSSYQPISCEFHDGLEAHATLRDAVPLTFRAEDGSVQERTAVITDVFAREGAEFVSLSNGEEVRLDRLIEVAGSRLADY